MNYSVDWDGPGERDREPPTAGLTASEAAVLALQADVDGLSAFLRVLAEELVNAGLPGGDRAVILANVRTLIAERKAVLALRKALVSALKLPRPWMGTTAHDSDLCRRASHVQDRDGPNHLGVADLKKLVSDLAAAIARATAEPTEEEIEVVRLIIETAYGPAVDARAPYAKFMSKKAADDVLAFLATCASGD